MGGADRAAALPEPARSRAARPRGVAGGAGVVRPTRLSASGRELGGVRGDDRFAGRPGRAAASRLPRRGLARRRGAGPEGRRRARALMATMSRSRSRRCAGSVEPVLRVGFAVQASRSSLEHLGRAGGAGRSGSASRAARCGGVGGAEVGPVAGEHRRPTARRASSTVVGDQVGGVGCAAAGHPDVGRRGAGVLADHEVRRGDGVALHPVRGRGVGELDMRAHVVGGQDAAAPCGAGDGRAAPSRCTAVTVQVSRLATSGRCRCGGSRPGHRHRSARPAAWWRVVVVDAAGGDEPVADRGVERGDLLAGVGHDRWPRVAA